jgi:hypothetical protein
MKKRKKNNCANDIKMRTFTCEKQRNAWLKTRNRVDEPK